MFFWSLDDHDIFYTIRLLYIALIWRPQIFWSVLAIFGVLWIMYLKKVSTCPATATIYIKYYVMQLKL